METGKGYSREEYMNRIENNEVDIYELFRYILGKWKLVLILCAAFFLIFALAAGVLSGSDDGVSKLSLDQFAEERQNKIRYALKLYDELEDMEVYENSSAYMEINPYECHITTLQYMITDKTAAGNSFKAYKAFVDSGRLKKIIEDEMGREIVRPSELVSLSTYEQSLLENANTVVELSQVLSVKVTSPDKNIGGRITQMIKKSFEEYRKELLSIVGNHDMKLLSENSYIGSDQGVRSTQSAFEIEKDRRRVQITNIENELNAEEKLLLEQLKNDGMQEEEDASSQGGGLSLKILILLFVMSIGFSCIIVVCYYMFGLNNRVKDEDDIVSIFGLPCIGQIMKKERPESKLKLQEEIEILCSKNGIRKVFVSLMTDSKEAEEYIGFIKEKMKEKEIEIVVGGNIIDNIEAVKAVQCYEKIILISESKKTTYSAIDKVLQKCNNWGISVVGVINYKG